jgi:hypothetical protein
MFARWAIQKVARNGKPASPLVLLLLFVRTLSRNFIGESIVVVGATSDEHKAPLQLRSKHVDLQVIWKTTNGIEDGQPELLMFRTVLTC